MLSLAIVLRDLHFANPHLYFNLMDRFVMCKPCKHIREIDIFRFSVLYVLSTIPCCQKSQAFFLKAVTFYTGFYLCSFSLCWIVDTDDWVTLADICCPKLNGSDLFSKCVSALDQSWSSPASTAEYRELSKWSFFLKKNWIISPD